MSGRGSRVPAPAAGDQITGSGRVWFLIDDAQHKVWLTVVESGHPSKTDK